METLTLYFIIALCVQIVGPLESQCDGMKFEDPNDSKLDCDIFRTTVMLENALKDELQASQSKVITHSQSHEGHE